MYSLFFHRVLTRLDAETAHSLTMRLLRLLCRLPGLLGLVTTVLGRPAPLLRVQAMGLQFASPLGLAAGFDKDAEVFPAMTAFGFGFVEVGTVTGQPQQGNPRPRMARLPQDHALVNRMGFNNHGAAAAAARMKARTGDAVVGSNIGKTKRVPDGSAVDDYIRSARLLAPVSDYLVVNVSSPNTPGLRDLQAVQTLRPLLTAVLRACTTDGSRPPVLVKIAPDLSDDDVDAVADLALELGLDGLIVANTTITRVGLTSGPAEVEAAGGGGLSGRPLKHRSLELLHRLYGRVGERLVLVSVGGVEDADDVYERLAAGATLVQAYTAMVYTGPAFASVINTDLANMLRRDGITAQQLIGRAAPRRD